MLRTTNYPPVPIPRDGFLLTELNILNFSYKQTEAGMP